MKLVKLEELGRAKSDRPETEKAKPSECKAKRALRWLVGLSDSEPRRRPVRRLREYGVVW